MHTHTVNLLHLILLSLFSDGLWSYSLISPHSLQLCSVITGWCMTPVVQLALPHVPAFSRVHTPSVALSPVWRAASALLAWSGTVSQIYQTSPDDVLFGGIFLCIYVHIYVI